MRPVKTNCDDVLDAETVGSIFHLLIEPKRAFHALAFVTGGNGPTSLSTHPCTLDGPCIWAEASPPAL